MAGKQEKGAVLRLRSRRSFGQDDDQLDAETRNRNRLRFREAVRGPSTSASFARFGQDDKEKECVGTSAGNLTPNPFPWGKGNNRGGDGIVVNRN